MAHGVVRTDLMIGTRVEACLHHVKYMVDGANNTSTPTAIDNGNVLKLSGMLSREVWKGVTPAANTSVENLVLVATPELIYDERVHNIDEFFNEAGDVLRCYTLHRHDIFSVTADALDAAAEIAVGDIVEAQASTKLKVVKSATNGSAKVGKVVAIETKGRYTYYVIQIND